MKNIFFVSVALMAFSSLANADQLCGRLNGYDVNGPQKTITPSYCTNKGCTDGAVVNLQAQGKGLKELNDLLESGGEGVRVCAIGTHEDSASFLVSSASEEK